MAPREARGIAVSNPAGAEAEVELSLGLSVGGVGGGAAAAEDRAAMEAAAARSRARDREAREAEPISGVRRSAATAAQFPRMGFLPNPNAPAPYVFPYPYPHPHPHQQVQYMPVWNGFRFQYMAPCWSPAAAPPEAAAAGVGNAVNRSAGEGGCAAASPVSSPRTGSSSSDVSDQQSGSVRGSSDWSHSRSNSGTSVIEKRNSSASQSSLLANTATTANTSANGDEPVPSSKDSKHKDPLLPQMPCVTTTGNGPNGRTVTGFLYRYTKSEVRILCVCHGKSFSPTEFVEHAGGTDVAHPLRRIVVVPS